MELFCSDLDNTLIYSYKRPIGEDKILVETKDGKELSFMSWKSYELLEKIKDKIELIPITTRSLEQYNRIQLSSQWKPKYALVANGGILLINGKIDRDWYQASKHLIEPCKEVLNQGISLLNEDEYVNFQVRKVDQLFVFTKSKEPEKTIENLKKHLNLDLVSVHQNGVKVYIFPKRLNKGHALERIKAFLSSHFVIAAGDSDFDIPMLQKADLGIYPKELEEAVLGENSVKVENALFSDGLLQFIWNFLKKYK